MIKEILYLLYYTFGLTLWVRVPTIILFIIIIVSLIIFNIILLVYLLYRPNISQKYFNVVLDHIIPFITLISPFIIIMKINTTEVFWIHKFVFMIIIHVIVVMPFIYYWSKHRHYWINTNNKEVTYISWKHPIIYFYIAMALIYIYVWAFYFSFIRFIRLGINMKINLLDMLEIVFNIENGVFLLFFLNMWHTIFLGCLVLFTFFIVIQKNIWEGFCVLIYSLHIQLIHYNIYVNIMEKLYKTRFVFYNIICLNAPLNLHKPYESYNIMRRGLNQIYYRPFILCVIPLIFIFFEIIFGHRLYFSFYILFCFPIILSCGKALNALGITFFVKDVCMVDYRRQNLGRIRYKPVFWKYIEDPDLFYGFSVIVSDNEYLFWEKTFLEFSQKNQIYSYKLSERLFEKINRLQREHPYSLFVYFARIKIAYHKTYHIRWNYKKSLS